MTAGDGGQTIAEKLRIYVDLSHKAGERLTSANAAIRGAGVNRNAGLSAWADLLRREVIRRHPDGGFYVA